MAEQNIFTIGMLRDRLDKLEADWVQNNYPEYFGAFDSQPLLTDYHEERDGAIHYNGLGHVKVIAAWELGLLILPQEFHGHVREIQRG